MSAILVGDFVKRSSDDETIYKVLRSNTQGITCAKMDSAKHKKSDSVPHDIFPENELTLYLEDLPRLWRIRTCVSICGIIIGVLCCLAAFYDAQHGKKLALLVTAIWAFGPPSWFIAEYSFLYPKWGNRRNKDDLKHGQGLAKDFWIGVAAMIAVIYKILE